MVSPIIYVDVVMCEQYVQRHEGSNTTSGQPVLVARCVPSPHGTSHAAAGVFQHSRASRLWKDAVSSGDWLGFASLEEDCTEKSLQTRTYFPRA